jgi:hypothetical protein
MRSTSASAFASPRKWNLRDGAERLANKNGGWSLVEGAVGAVCRDERHASVAEVAPACLLHDLIAGEAACRLDDDGADAFAEKALTSRRTLQQRARS